MKYALLTLLFFTTFYQLNALDIFYETEIDSGHIESLLNNRSLEDPIINDTDDHNNTSLLEQECENPLSSMPDLTMAVTGSGTSSITLQLENKSRDLEFSIVDLDQMVIGNPNGRYTDLVTVSYVDGEGMLKNYSVYSGSGSSEADVFIDDVVKSVTITLEDGYLKNSNLPLSVTLQDIQYCHTPCTDSDEDGICDDVDICTGFDDLVDDDNDAIPNGCDDCTEIITSFKDNPLRHLGTGACLTSLDLVGQRDISFTISDLDTRLNGTEKKHYVDKVWVEYIDGNGQLGILGPYDATDYSEVEIDIPGVVLSLRVILENAIDNDAELSIDLSDISACASESVPSITNFEELLKFKNYNLTKSDNMNPNISLDKKLSFKVYPIPFNESINIDLSKDDYTSDGELLISDLLGRSIFRQKIAWSGKISEEVNTANIKSGIYFITYRDKVHTYSHQITKFR